MLTICSSINFQVSLTLSAIYIELQEYQYIPIVDLSCPKYGHFPYLSTSEYQKLEMCHLALVFLHLAMDCVVSGVEVAWVCWLDDD